MTKDLELIGELLAGGIGGIAIIIIGRIGDIWGLSAAVSVMFLLPIVAGLIGLFMKSRPATHIQRATE
jgi:FSR family fosmidomycin resistance protein-like MFS transporter